MLTIGYYSLPVVGMTALFTGAVLALQIYLGSARFGAESAVPNIVVVGLTRELGPVLADLMLGGRVGAAIAAELGTMKVTEQLDALITLQTNPFRYLVVPRLVAATLTTPIRPDCRGACANGSAWPAPSPRNPISFSLMSRPRDWTRSWAM